MGEGNENKSLFLECLERRVDTHDCYRVSEDSSYLLLHSHIRVTYEQWRGMKEMGMKGMGNLAQAYILLFLMEECHSPSMEEGDIFLYFQSLSA